MHPEGWLGGLLNRGPTPSESRLTFQGLTCSTKAHPEGWLGGLVNRGPTLSGTFTERVRPRRVEPRFTRPPDRACSPRPPTLRPNYLQIAQVYRVQWLQVVCL